MDVRLSKVIENLGLNSLENGLVSKNRGRKVDRTVWLRVPRPCLRASLRASCSHLKLHIPVHTEASCVHRGHLDPSQILPMLLWSLLQTKMSIPDGCRHLYTRRSPWLPAMRPDWNLPYCQAAVSDHREKRMQQDFCPHPHFGHYAAKTASAD